MEEKVGFIGVGNMGAALACAVCQAIPSTSVYVADSSKEKMMDLYKRTGVVISDTKTVAAMCDYIFIGVKPQALSALFEEIGDALASNPDATLISMAAGIPIARLEELAGAPRPIIRIMPNTPVLSGEGMIVYTFNSCVTWHARHFFKKILSEAGVLEEILEEQMNAACAISGCGPAFVYMFIEALIQGGVECGLPEMLAKQLAVQTVIGAPTLSRMVSKSLCQLREDVCSPGGSTIEGVHVLQDGDLYRLVSDAVKASYKRANELSKA